MSDDTAGWTADPFMIAFTPLRRVTARESPYAGTLVRSPAGVHLLIDPEQVPPAELFWSPQEDTHVLRAIDVVHMGTARSDAAPGALVEACREPLETYLDLRDGAGAPITAPECATIMISLLRGVNEVRAAVRKDRGGVWWLSSSARPVLALIPDAEPARESACRILNRLAPADPHAPALRDAIMAVLRGDDVRAGDIDSCERAVFEWVEPGPLRPSPDIRPAARLASAGPTPTPLSVPTPSLAHALAAASVQTRSEADVPVPHEPGVFDRLVRGGDGRWQEALAEVAASARGTMRSLRRSAAAARPGGRGRLVVAALAVGAVLAVGVAVLAPNDGTAQEQVPSGGKATGDSAPAAAATAVPDADAGEPDLPRTAAVIMDAVSTCAGDSACVQTVAERPDLAPSTGAATAPAGQRKLELVDEYGDVAVIRAEADGYPSQLVVIARHDDRWLLREVLDLTQQPPS